MERTLDWKSNHDERSKDYSIERILSTTRDPRRRREYWPFHHLDQLSEGACFPAGTFVRMSDGSHKVIEDIQTLDSVVTAEGNHGLVLQTMVRKADSLIRVKTRGHLDLLCTPEHPILTKNGYKAASTIDLDDLIAITKADVVNDDFIDVDNIVSTKDIRGVLSGVVNTGGVETTVTALPTLIAKTPAFGRLIGLYAAEGSCTPNKVVWSYGGHELETLVTETVDLIKTVFDAVARIQKRPNGAINVVLYGKAWKRLFEEIVPGTSKHGTKHLSSYITSGSKLYREAILYGWLNGDGHQRRTEWDGVTVCHQLALDMHSIANDLGMTPSIRKSKPSLNKHAATRQQRYDVIIPLGGGANISPTSDENTVWRKVTEISSEVFEGWVYNLTVQGDESYVANGIGVHNCVGHAVVGAVTSQPYFRRIRHAQQAAFGFYRLAQFLDPWPGEDYEGTSVLAGVKVAHRTGHITGYYWTFGIEQTLDALVGHGPVIIGVNWYNDMFYTRPSGLVEIGGSYVGGHALYLNGFYPDASFLKEGITEPVVRWKNSWGLGYGVNRGHGYIKVSDLETLLKENGEACVLTP